MNIYSQFKTPWDIQVFLNSLKYRSKGEARSPVFVFKEKKAHCFDGAIFAAAALEKQGYKPLIIDLEAKEDDDHILAVFKKDEFWGAVAKSNTTVLRYREPVYKTIRELIMSYFDVYFSVTGYKSLRKYSRPINLNRFNKFNWRTTESSLDFIEKYLFEVKHHDIITKKMEKNLSTTDPDLIKAGFLTSDPEGLFIPKQK